MALTVNTNVASLTAQRNLTSSQSDLSTSLARLSSGLRINSAKDDAAGLAISERFTAQIKGLNQGVRNANDGISLAQTAEGALKEVTSNLQRIRELAVQSANATNSASDRTALQAEVSQLVSEIDRVSQNTSFNGIKLLDGTFSSKSFQVGANSGETVDIASVTSARTSALGLKTEASVSVAGGERAATNRAAVIATDATIAIGSGTAVAIGANDGSSKSLAAVINSSITGVTATAGATTAANSTAANAAASATGKTITINGVATAGFNVAQVAATDRATATAAINAISAATGVTAVDDGVGIDLTAADGRSIVLTTTLVANTDVGIAAAGTYDGALTLTASEQIVIAAGAGTIANTGLSAGTTAASSTGTAVSVVDVSSTSGANDAIAALDSALATVNATRSTLGSYQSRFESVVANAQTAVENLSASRSRIMDADFAQETAQLTKSQILQQSGIAMLAQANSIPQNVLAFLQ